MAAPHASRPLPLEPGDHLTREEFERRYDTMPQIKKAELIEGVVYMPSPVRCDRHAGPHFDMITWLGVYRAGTPGIRGMDNGMVRLDLDNEPQPDITLFIEPVCGGQARLSADDFLEGSPELCAEVAASSASFDLHTKLHVYRRNGVCEYLVWRVLDQAIDWFTLREGRYEPLASAADGVLRSTVFPGLWLDAAALVRGNLAQVLAVLQQGLVNAEHAAFVAGLQGISKKKG